MSMADGVILNKMTKMAATLLFEHFRHVCTMGPTAAAMEAPWKITMEAPRVRKHPEAPRKRIHHHGGTMEEPWKHHGSTIYMETPWKHHGVSTEASPWASHGITVMEAPWK
eukprot:TRINITY_DN2792_c0_g1_i1.p1 TRINITY_DN2792_c0_g1~~TRINITY_DN2792_c0_g1_i1.p1  ORF type:complete len:111 (+),score=4.65 TRINITY_DN2792_c0_g1_i1:53-385(+)